MDDGRMAVAVTAAGTLSYRYGTRTGIIGSDADSMHHGRMAVVVSAAAFLPVPVSSDPMPIRYRP